MLDIILFAINVILFIVNAYFGWSNYENNKLRTQPRLEIRFQIKKKLPSDFKVINGKDVQKDNELVLENGGEVTAFNPNGFYVIHYSSSTKTTYLKAFTPPATTIFSKERASWNIPLTTDVNTSSMNFKSICIMIEYRDSNNKKYHTCSWFYWQTDNWGHDYERNTM